MPLKDFLKAFEHDPQTFDFDAFVKKVESEHDLDLEGPTAKITTLEQQNQDNSKLVTQLKADKYDLLMKTGTPVTPAAPKDPASTDATDDGTLPISAAFGD